MSSEKNPYTQERGYKYGYNDYPNGWFIVCDRQALGEKWYLEPEQHRWVVIKMPDRDRKTAETLDAAKMLAIVSARGIHDHECWWR